MEAGESLFRLVGMPVRIKGKVDVPGILSGLGFETVWAAQGGYCKYVHLDMEVEFHGVSQVPVTVSQ